jgi:hypothetical protein
MEFFRYVCGFLCCTRFRKVNLNISFIDDLAEQKMLEDAIRAANSIPDSWDWLRRTDPGTKGYINLQDEMKTKIVQAFSYKPHYEASIAWTLHQLRAMAINQNEWIINRLKSQDKDNQKKIFINNWRASHIWTPSMNKAVLLSYLENILAHIADSEWDICDITKSGAVILLQDLEYALSQLDVEKSQAYISLAKNFPGLNTNMLKTQVIQNSDDFQNEIRKRLIEMPLSDYYVKCKERWAEHVSSIESYERIKAVNVQNYVKTQIELSMIDLFEAVKTRNPADLKRALNPEYRGDGFEDTDIYKEAVELLHNLEDGKQSL